MNSETMMPDYWRQLDFYDPAKDNNHVLVVGAGSGGSYIVFGLARMGVRNITVVDFDVVEAHNLPNQFFAESLIPELMDESGKVAKVDALKATINFMIPDNGVKYIKAKVEEAPDLLKNRWDVIISAVDSMAVRRWIFEHIPFNFLIDPRSGGEFVNIFTCTEYEKEAHRRNLWTDEEVDKIHKLPCTGTSIIDVCWIDAGEVIQRYRKYVSGNCVVEHSFHDCKVGGTGMVMSLRDVHGKRDSLIGENDNVTNTVINTNEWEADVANLDIGEPL
jgi:hypothetical protein